MQYLYHGTPNKIIGDYLIPKKAKDLENRKENTYTAVYATDIKEIAIAMVIIKSPGIDGSTLDFLKKPYGTIYKGWPKQEYVFLYYLPKGNFIQLKGSGHQFISKTKVKHIKIEKIKIKDFLHLVKKSTEKETVEFYAKYNINKN